MLDKTKKDWWKHATIYQIYPKSFQDTDGDGIGDIDGIRMHLDYLEKLGIDAIWLSPVFASPQADNGYDVSDYRDIDPMFGNMDKMRLLIQEAKARGISIIMDMVFNHSSEEHYWFREAKKSKDNPYHDYYIWRDGTPDKLPNGMKAIFGGPAWKWVPECGQYYYHMFAEQQPDFNWENPKVREELYDIVRFWMDQGAEGFRMDAIDYIGKDVDKMIIIDNDKIHKYMKELSRETFQHGNVVSVGEAWSADTHEAPKYSNPDGSEFSMVFQFEHPTLDYNPDKWNLKPFEVKPLKKCMKKWQQELAGKGWNSLFWENHDLPRIVSHWGDDGKYREKSAKALAMLLFGMQGTPYIYQGQELGMTNVRMPIEDYRDIEILNMYKEKKAEGVPEEQIMEAIYRIGRDNARTPMQWSTAANAGFTKGEPWIKVNPNYREVNADEALARDDSLFYCYQKLISMRKEMSVFEDGDFELLQEDDPQVFAYVRSAGEEKVLVYANMSGAPAHLEIPAEFAGAPLCLTNEPGRTIVSAELAPWEAGMTKGRINCHEIV